MAEEEKMCESSINSEITDLSQSIIRHVNSLSDPNRSVRKRGLEGVNKELFTKDHERLVLKKVFKDIQIPVVKLISDSVEKCRELAITIIDKYLRKTQDVETVLPVIAPCLVQRLGQQDLVEPSEELRLQILQMTEFLISEAQKRNSLYLDDFVKVFQRTLVDPYPEVKKQSCLCISILAKAIPEHFHTQSESLIKPLAVSITHQHSRVRVAVINAIGQVLLYGNNKNVDDVVSHLAQRLFDHAPIVREAVTKVVGMWLLELPDRYSFWHKLMPLLLTSLTDELPSIQEAAASLWHDVGIQYLRENEDDLKEKENFASPQPAHYPPNIERPNLGCRELMYRNQSKILPGLSHDILDWVVETRKKSAALLYTILINSENNITQHVNLIVESVYKAAIDEERIVVDYVEKSMILLGYFVTPDVWLPIVLPAVQKYQHVGSILVLSHLIKGSQLEVLSDKLPQICKVMSNTDICTSGQLTTQQRVIEFVNAVLKLYSLGVLEPIEVSFDLFKILMCVISVSGEESTESMANESLNELALVQGIERAELFKLHTIQLLDSFGDSYLYWTNHSVERLIFDTVIMYCGPVVGDILDKVMPMITVNMKPEKDAEVRLKLFSLISRLIQSSAETINSSNRFSEFSVTVIKDIILPNCVWKAGKTATAIRTNAVSCLWCLLKNQMISSEQLMTVVEDTVTQLLSLIEDDSLDTRLITCRTIMHMLNISGISIERHRLYNLYPHLLKRLDDSNDNVRIAVTKTLISYFKCFDGKYDVKSYRGHLQDLVKGLLIHLDDPNPEVQEAVQAVLEQAGQIEPNILLKEVEVVKHKHRTPKYCNALVQYCSGILCNGA